MRWGAALWVRHLPPASPSPRIWTRLPGPPLPDLGGNIRNIVAAAAYSAAAAGRPVAMADLIKGTEREYRKLGHLSTEAEFGPTSVLSRRSAGAQKARSAADTTTGAIQLTTGRGAAPPRREPR